MSNLPIFIPSIVKCFQVFNPYPANYPLTLWHALLNNYKHSLLRVQMELIAHVIGTRWPYHSKDAHDRLGVTLHHRHLFNSSHKEHVCLDNDHNLYDHNL